MQSWNEISSNAIENCWRKVGFLLIDNFEIHNEIAPISLEVIKECIEIDRYIQCSPDDAMLLIDYFISEYKEHEIRKGEIEYENKTFEKRNKLVS